MAASGSRNRPPSENESGVTLTTPMTSGRTRRESYPAVTADGSNADPRRPISAPWMKRMASSRVAAFVAEQAPHRRGDRGRARLADAPHRHAQVLGLDHHQHAPGLRALRSMRVGDLGGEPLLHLRALGVAVDQPGQLRQAGDAAVVVRDVGDVGLAR